MSTDNIKIQKTEEKSFKTSTNFGYLKKISISNLLNSNFEDVCLNENSYSDNFKKITLNLDFFKPKLVSKPTSTPNVPTFHVYSPQTAERVTRRGSWSEEEKMLFEKGYNKIGKNWTAISKKFVTTRTRRQVGNYARKFLEENQL